MIPAIMSGSGKCFFRGFVNFVHVVGWMSKVNEVKLKIDEKLTGEAGKLWIKVSLADMIHFQDEKVMGFGEKTKRQDKLERVVCEFGSLDYGDVLVKLRRLLKRFGLVDDKTHIVAV